MNLIALWLSTRLVFTLAHIALALALLVLPIAFAVRYAASSDDWWQRGFDRYDAVARTGLTPAEVDRVAAETRDYLASDDERLAVSVDGVPFYSEREVLHMVDVKRLMARVYDAGWGSLGYIIAFAAFILWRAGRAALRTLARSVLLACGLAVAAVVILGGIGLSGFDAAFRDFHLIFFTNDLWQLSSRDALIQLFPQRFFFDTTLLIGGVTLAFVAVAGALSATVLWRARR